MDPAIQLLYREHILLDESAPQTVRSRIAAFSPLLGEVGPDIQLAASELATAFLRYGGPKVLSSDSSPATSSSGWRWSIP